MKIILAAHENRRRFLLELCLAYSVVLSRHELFSPQETATFLNSNTNLKVSEMIPSVSGGDKQITSMIESNEVDMLIFLRDNSHIRAWDISSTEMLEKCNIYNIPLATNPASAELLILGLSSGYVNWRSLK